MKADGATHNGSKGTWLKVAVIFAVLIAGAEIVYLKSLKNEVKELRDQKGPVYCVVDLMSLADKKAIEIAEKKNVKKIEEALSNTEVKEEINQYLKKARTVLDHPETVGCDYIFVKGAIIGGRVSDVTTLIEARINK